MTHCVSSSWKSQYNWTFSILGLQRGCLPRVLRARCAIILTRFCVLWPLQRSNRGCIFFCFFSARQKNTENHSQISPTDRHTIIAQSHPFFFSDGRKVTEFASTIIKNFNSRAVTTPACLWLFLQFCISVSYSGSVQIRAWSQIP